MQPVLGTMFLFTPLLLKDVVGHVDEEAELMGRWCRHRVDVMDPLNYLAGWRNQNPRNTPWPKPVRPQWRRAVLARPGLHHRQRSSAALL